MSIISFFDRLAFLISVPRCVCCKAHLSYGERALCAECLAKYEEIKTRNCSNCSRLLSRCTCANEYLTAHSVKNVIKVFRYKNREENLPANSVIYSLKKDNRSDVLSFCTDELADAIFAALDTPSECIVTNVPRRRAQIVKYGIDHAELLARSIAKKTSATYMRILKSNVKTAQKEMYGKDRVNNISFDYIDDSIDLKGKTVILIDDIITTGASVGAAGMLLRGLGAKRVIGASLAIAYKDNFSYI